MTGILYSSQTAALCIDALESLLKSNSGQVFCQNLERTEESTVKKQEVTCQWWQDKFQAD